jgi:ABC-2 type transport system permease protein
LKKDVAQNFILELKVSTSTAKKELLINFRYPLWVIFWAIMPVFWLAPLVFQGQALIGGRSSTSFAMLSGNSDFITFNIVGSSLYAYVMSALWGMDLSLRREQWSGTLETLMVSPCNKFFILLGKAFSSMLTTSLWVILQLILSTLVFNLRINFINLPIALFLLLIALPSFLGIGFSLAGIVLEFKEHNAFVNFLTALFSLLLPISYPLVVLPPFLRYFSYLLPPTYAIEGMRNVLILDSSLGDLINLILPLLFFDVFWLLFGSIVFLMEEKRVMKKGALGYY